MSTKDEARAAARAHAAAGREAAARRRRRNRLLAIVGAAVGVVVAAGVVVLLIVNLTAAPGIDGRTSSPPWAAPSNVSARVRAAGLQMLTAEGEALHIHQHLSITIDGKATTVPAGIGIDEAARQLSAIHTHDTSGIIHVESPVVKTFRLGQVFTEWDVALAKGRVGGYVNGRDGVKVALFLDRRPYTADPRQLALGARQDIDFVITTNGATPKAPTKAFTFPANY